MKPSLVGIGVLCALLATATSYAQDAGRRPGPGPRPGASTLPDNKMFADPTGKSSSFSTLARDVDLNGSFFQKLGTNDRSCGTCHLPSDGWTVSARTAQKLFNDTDGLAALFQGDGQNVANADVSTRAARMAASSLMISKALVRFNLEVGTMRNVTPEFDIVDSTGTYGNPVDARKLVVFRRPLPVTNLGALTTVLWDGRGNFIAGAPTPNDAVAAIFTAGVSLHEVGTLDPTPQQVSDGAALMLSLTNAQIVDNKAGALDRDGALGGAENHSRANLFGDPGFTIYDAFAGCSARGGAQAAAREQIARGQNLFNNRPFPGGGSCSGCHDVSNQGNSATNTLFNIGIADADRRTADLPLYTLRNLATGEMVQTSDPGLAITSGLWADIGSFKVPSLRGLASRAPYFHNGMATDLDAVIDFYDDEFGLGLSDAEHDDLVAFLRAL